MIINIPNYLGSISAIEIPTVDNGREFKTLISVADGFIDVSSSGAFSVDTTTTLPLTVVGTTEETSKGLRRILVKVTAPYVSVSEQQCCGSDTATRTTRMAGDMSMHIVLTLPRAAVQDVSKGGASQEAVAARVALLQNVLESLLRLGDTPVAGDANAYVAGSNTPSLLYWADRDGGAVLGTGIKDPNAMTHFFGPASPFMRGANLLAPFTSGGTYGAVQTSSSTN